MGFNYDNMRIVVESKRMNIYGAENEAMVKKVIGWIIDKIK